MNRRRFMSTAPPKQPLPEVEEAEVEHIPPKTASTHNPFSESLWERLTPHTTEILGLVAAAMMLAVAVKLARERGEAVEKETRYVERIVRVKLEIAELEQSLPNVLVEELAKDVTLANYFKTEAGMTKIRAVAASATARAMEQAKIAAVKQFEAKLWVDGSDEENQKAMQPAKQGEKGVLY